MKLLQQLFLHIEDNVKNILFNLFFQILCLNVEFWEELAQVRVLFLENFCLVLSCFSLLNHLVVVFLTKYQICELFSFLQILVEFRILLFKV